MAIEAALLGGLGLAGSIYSANKASSTAKSVANIELQALRDKLEYQKDLDEIPRRFREASLERLGGMYGLPGGTGTERLSPEELLLQANDSPFLGLLREGGEEAILRNQSATGRLRSGDTIDQLSEFNVRTLLQTYNMLRQDRAEQESGLQSLSNLPSYGNQIANTIGDIGSAGAAGRLSQGQIEQQKLQNIFDSLGSVAGDYLYGLNRNQTGQGLNNQYRNLSFNLP